MTDASQVPEEPQVPEEARVPLVGPPPKSIPQVPQGTPKQQAGGVDPKDPFKDPNSLHYEVVLWAGIGNSVFRFACPTDISAALGAYALAAHHPEVHTFAVWRKDGPEPDAKTVDQVCFVALHQMIRACSPSIEKLTGKGANVPAVPIVTPEAGFDALGKQLKDKQGSRQ